MTAAVARLRSFCRNHETALWLLLIVCIASALRFIGLTFQSYWFDELFSAWYSNPANSFARVMELTLADVHPPLHQLAMWWSYKALGYSEFAGRLPSALAGVATIPVIYLLGRDLFDNRTGLYAAALATPNYYLLYFAQEARSYALLCFLTCLSCLLFIRSLRSGAWSNVLLYVVATVALLYTHYFAFVVLAIQGSMFLVYWLLWVDRERQLLVRAVTAGTLVLLSLIPLASVVIQHAGIKDFWIVQPPLLIAASYFVGYFGGTLLAACFAGLIVGAILVAGMRAIRGRLGGWTAFSIVALLVWVVLGYLLPWLRGLVAQPVITDRNTIILLPPLLILAAFGLRSLLPLALQRFAGLLLLGFSIYHLVFGIDYYHKVKKNQYREMAAALTAYPTPVPVYALQFNEPKYNVYFEQSNSHLRAEDYGVLETKLESGTAEAVFWIASGHLVGLNTDIEERFDLVQVARYDFRGTVAELLLNPRQATRVPLEQSVLAAGSGTTWFSAQPFRWKRGNAQLLLALNPAARSDPARKVQLDLLDVQGHVLESHSAVLGAIPSTLQLSPQLDAGEQARLVVRMPYGEPEPEVWIIDGGPDTR